MSQGHDMDPMDYLGDDHNQETRRKQKMTLMIG